MTTHSNQRAINIMSETYCPCVEQQGAEYRSGGWHTEGCMTAFASSLGHDVLYLLLAETSLAAWRHRSSSARPPITLRFFFPCIPEKVLRRPCLRCCYRESSPHPQLRTLKTLRESSKYPEGHSIRSSSKRPPAKSGS